MAIMDRCYMSRANDDSQALTSTQAGKGVIFYIIPEKLADEGDLSIHKD